MKRSAKAIVLVALAMFVAATLAAAWLMRPQPTATVKASAPAIVTRPVQATTWQDWSQRVVNQLSASPTTTGFPQALVWDPSPYSGSSSLKCSPKQLTKLAKSIPGHTSVSIADDVTGKTLYGRYTTTTVEPASVMKLVTASTALYTLGPNARLQTKVVLDKHSHTVTIVGGGDPTLTTLKKNRYGAHRTLNSLAAQVKRWARQHDLTIRTVRYDSSLFAGASIRKAWGSDVLASGYTGKISALTLDAGRLHPKDKYSARSSNPAKMTAQSFAKLLGKHIKVKQGKAAHQAQLIASVYSPRLSTIMSVMLKQSDNVVAETVGRLAAISWGDGSTFTAVGKASQRVLKILDVSTQGLRLRDGSGYGSDNRLTTATVNELLLRIGDKSSPVHGLRTLLAKSGHAGTLKERFDGSSHVAKNAVQAKTGTLEGVGAMAGFLKPRHGNLLVFTVITNGAFDLEKPKNSIDKIVATVYRCGTDVETAH